jgi:hypothetical protein
MTPIHGKNTWGVASFVQLDVEPIQGVHALLTGEAANTGETGAETSLAGWGSVNWFFAPHTDLRLDAVEQRQAVGTSHTDITTLLAQLHVYL